MSLTGFESQTDPTGMGASPIPAGVGMMPRAPDFELPDAAGGSVRLRDQLGGGGVILVFYRGHWCPYCRRYLTKLQGASPRFDQRGARLLAISPEPPATSAALAAELGLTFPLLSDVEGRVIDFYGTRNGFSAARTLLPHPAVFILDGGGSIRFRGLDRNYRKRTTLGTIFRQLDAI